MRISFLQYIFQGTFLIKIILIHNLNTLVRKFSIILIILADITHPSSPHRTSLWKAANPFAMGLFQEVCHLSIAIVVKLAVGLLGVRLI